MRTMSLPGHLPARGWQLAAAAGFVALTIFAAGIDRRTALIDRRSPAPNTIERAVTPLTNGELAQEMMTHD